MGALALHASEDLALQARGEALRILADGERGIVRPGRRSRGFRWGGVHGWRAHGQRRAVELLRRGNARGRVTRRDGRVDLYSKHPVFSPRVVCARVVVRCFPRILHDDPPRAKLSPSLHILLGLIRGRIAFPTHPLRISLEVRLDARVFRVPVAASLAFPRTRKPGNRKRRRNEAEKSLMRTEGFPFLPFQPLRRHDHTPARDSWLRWAEGGVPATPEAGRPSCSRCNASTPSPR